MKGMSMNDFIRYLKALFNGTYKVFPWRSFFLLLYIISPIDFLPEALLPVIGIADDVAAFGLLIATIRIDIQKFLAWEGANPAHGDVVDAEFEEVKDERAIAKK
jgi:uncharacterized membrane protein YkvA (DUF1232 family)